ncbi:IS66 family transposase [Eisenbergiella massiliensis]|uniref:IS66 family transposase n=1 Tax=Eisenbergiella massiliensis TaxID=1720294 RepID=UPI001FA8CB6C|nr:transposase [Eisenbergiella massiliensis]
MQNAIEQELLNSDVNCTDVTPVKTDGKQTHIRNFSTEACVLYCSSEKKDLETLWRFRILKEYTGTLIHDHEIALYYFGTGHGECNVHLERYLLKNTEETGNSWSHKLSCFLEGMNQARKQRILQGGTCFTPSELERYSLRYEDLLSEGREENRHTKGRIAKKEEKALLKRLKKYGENHLLFLYDFRIPYSNNRSEKDLRICKSRQKMAGGFRTADGREMYCAIMSL